MGAVPAIVGTIVSVATTVASTAASIAMAQQKAQQESEQARNNAILALRQANDTRQRGENKAARVKAKGRRAGAEALAAAGASSFSTTEGSIANLLDASGINAAVDAETVRANAMREAWGLDNEAQGHASAGAAARSAGIMSSVGHGISGVGRTGAAAASGIRSIQQSSGGSFG